MAKTDYLPVRDTELLNWLSNLKIKLNTYGATIGLTNAEVTAIQAKCDEVTTRIQAVEQEKNVMQQKVADKEAVKKSNLDFIRKAIKRAKTHGNYTDAIGEDLDVIGEDNGFDPATLKPEIKLVKNAGAVTVKWKKGKAHALRIEVDRGNGWVFLVVDSVPDYTDTESMPSSGVWKYRAIYMINDTVVGQWSDIVVVSVP